MWCIQATSHLTSSKVIFLCDNWSACQAIRRGSSTPHIQEVAESIFLWCMEHGKICWPVWVPRNHSPIQEADRRSRLIIPHDERSPAYLVRTANVLSWIAWRSPLTFDQAASHGSAIEANGTKLPFNTYCMQPGASGVDMFSQWESWLGNINYVFPPRPMTGRLITFLPTTKSRSVVVFKGPVPPSWWSFAVQPGAPGVIVSVRTLDFVVVLFDFCTTTAALYSRALSLRVYAHINAMSRCAPPHHIPANNRHARRPVAKRPSTTCAQWCSASANMPPTRKFAMI